MSKIHLTWDETTELAKQVANDILRLPYAAEVTAYPVPRGGWQAFWMIATQLAERGRKLILTDLASAAIVIDDIVDSGATAARIRKEAGWDVQVFALVDKIKNPELDAWYVFPWEQTAEGLPEGPEENIRRLLQFIEGPTAKREGLVETPKRVAKAYDRWFGGYGKDPAAVLKVFKDGAENVDEMVVVRDIRFYSHCEHHMAPFFGTATVAYIPNGRIVGLSKIARLVDIFARRLQVQERLTNQVAQALFSELAPKGVGVILKARHLCIESRGVESIDSTTVTSALLGVFKTEASTRNEFMLFAK